MRKFEFRPKYGANSNDSESYNQTNFRYFSFNNLPQIADKLEDNRNKSNQLIGDTILTESQTNFSNQQNHTEMNDSMSESNSSGDSQQMRQRISKELEKIEIWKAITELDAKSKDKCIEELRNECEILRNNAMTFDKEKQSLIATINADKEEMQELIVKVNHNRELITKIKDMSIEFERRINDFKDIEDLLDQLNDLRSQQFEELDKKFDSLLNDYRNNLSSIEAKNQESEQKLSNLLEQLKGECTEKDTQINNTNRELEHIQLEFDKFKIDANNEVNERDNCLKQVKDQTILLENELNKRIDDLIAENNQLKSELNQINEQIANLKLKLESTEKSAKQANDEYVYEKNAMESESKELRELCDALKSENNEFEKRLIDNQSLFDENETTFNRMQLRIDSLVADIESIESSKQSLIHDYETRIKELNNNIQQNGIIIEELNNSNEKSILLIEEYSKDKEKMKNDIELMEKVITEKEMIEKDLIKEFENIKQSHDTEVKEHNTTADKLNKSNEDIIELNTKIEALNQEKQNVEQRLQEQVQSKCQLETQITNFSKILESCKDDYSKRIADKDERIDEYKRENQKLNTNLNQLMSRNEKIETEKSEISRRLQDITFSAIKPIAHSPITPIKPMKQEKLSQIENSRVSPIRTQYSGNASKSQSMDTSLRRSMTNSGNILSQTRATKSKLESIKIVNEYADENDEKINPKSKRPKTTNKQTAKSTINRKANTNTKPNGGKSVVKGRSHANIRSLSIASSDDTDIEDTYAKSNFGVKTYSKTGANNGLRADLNLRADNILDGRPTPTKDNDLSWLNF